jgi:hypothetical protein
MKITSEVTTPGLRIEYSFKAVRIIVKMQAPI